MPHPSSQPAQVLAWAEGNPLSEYQKEYYRKQLLRQQARRDKLRAAGKTKDYQAGEALLDFAAHHDALLGGSVTSNKLDYTSQHCSTIKARAPERPLMPERTFTAKTVYSNTYIKKPISLTAFDNKSNVNVARNQYDPTGNPWFGKSLNSVDYPDWGHPHQAPLVDKSRPLGPSMPFTATTTAKADYTAPTKRAERRRRSKAELVPSAPLANATMYRADLEWSGAASRAPPCTVGYLAGALPTLETACCQAAEAHSQELADALTGSDRQADRQRTPIKKELMGAAGASNAACTVLTGKRMYSENLQQMAGAPYAAGGTLKPETSYQRFCSTAVAC
ncbi:TPA: hypothetical protein ACH3X2_010335 [Trebouxia sp. C0005]